MLTTLSTAVSGVLYRDSVNIPVIAVNSKHEIDRRSLQIANTIYL